MAIARKKAAKPAPAPAPAPTKKAVAPKSKKRTVQEAQRDESDDEFGQVAIDMDSDDEEDMDGDDESDDAEADEFPEEDAEEGQDMSAADIEEDDDEEDEDSEGSYMDGDSLVDSQEENDEDEELEENEENDSDLDELINGGIIDPNFGHNLNEPFTPESDYNPIKREYPEIDPVYDSDSSTEEVPDTFILVIVYWLI